MFHYFLPSIFVKNSDNDHPVLPLRRSRLDMCRSHGDIVRRTATGRIINIRASPISECPCSPDLRIKHRGAQKHASVRMPQFSSISFIEAISTTLPYTSPPLGLFIAYDIEIMRDDDIAHFHLLLKIEEGLISAPERKCRAQKSAHRDHHPAPAQERAMAMRCCCPPELVRKTLE